MKSEIAFNLAQKYIPGGVNSPVRAFKSVGGTPRFITRAEGAFIYDIDDKKYIDYVASFGPAILGHSHPEVVKRVTEALPKGFGYGATTEIEIQVAEHLVKRVPNIDKVRMCNSGTEATMSALRLARAYTKRDNILKFSGCYHGHSDALLVDAGSGGLSFGVANSAGVPQAFTQHTLNAKYNDINNLEQIFQQYGNTLAAVILEAIAGNMSCVLPSPEFLQVLRNLCDKYGVLLIVDEVMTGFRVAKAGAQELLNLRADIVTFGKIIGGGMPVGAFAARAEIMDLLAPLGNVYQAGTLSGNPIAMTAGLATLELTNNADFYCDLNNKTEYLAQGLKKSASENNIPLTVNYCCGMLGIFFTAEKQINDLDAVKRSDSKRFAQFFHQMLDSGIYLPPSAFEALFIGACHSYEILDKTINKADEIFGKLQN